jgi:hypothetical protein
MNGRVERQTRDKMTRQNRTGRGRTEAQTRERERRREWLRMNIKKDVADKIKVKWNETS